MLNPATSHSPQLPESSPAYQQALLDFGITDLLHTLSQATEVNLELEELESLAAQLIIQLSQSLSAAQISRYLKASSFELRKMMATLPLPFPQFPASAELPNLVKAEKPRFHYGQSLRWRGEGETDWGVVIGRFYTFAPHQRNWGWCYLLMLDKHSLSAAWCPFDTAWEDDLEKFSHE